jgi:glucokinase
METILAFDFGGTKLSAGIIQWGSRHWLDKERIFTRPDVGAEEELRLMIELGDKVLSGRGPAAIGISFGGPVDFAAQQVRRSDHVPGWEDVPLADIFAERFSAPTVIDNDANVAALGEYVFGAGRGCRTLLYVTVSTGVGGGWILDGQVWRGAHGMAGEIGHIVVDPAGPRCLCGKYGCVERLASGPYMAQDATQWLQDRLEEGHILRQIFAEQGASGKSVSRAAAAGDKLAQEILSRGARALGVGLGNAANLIDPERIILGGGVTAAGNSWWEMVRRTAQATILPDIQVSIVPAGLGDDAPLWGAVALAEQLVDGK